MGLIDEVLDEFHGQIAKEEILHMTYKELGYLRLHRQKKNEKDARQPIIDKILQK